MQPPTHKRSILPPEFAGTMKFTGYKGIGKSWLAAQADLPTNMLFMDFDQKGEGINAQLQFGKFHSMQSEASKGEIKSEPLVLFDYTMQVVNEIEQDRYTVVVLDNVSPLETAIRAEAIRHVDKYCKAFGLNKKNVIAGRYGGSNSIKNYWIGEFVAALRGKGVQLVIMTSHISDRWIGGVPVPNKHSIKGGSKWDELSILSLILIPGANPPTPDAQVQKEQLGSITLNTSDMTDEQLVAMQRGETGHTMARRLPFRIPGCTFQKLRWYLTNPTDFDNLRDGEQIVESEFAPFRDKLTSQQIAYVHDAVTLEKRKEAQADALVEVLENGNGGNPSALAKQVRDLKAGGKSPMEIVGMVNEVESVIDVARLLKEAGA